jgi:hypothetical protein
MAKWRNACLLTPQSAVAFESSVVRSLADMQLVHGCQEEIGKANVTSGVSLLYYPADWLEAGS